MLDIEGTEPSAEEQQLLQRPVVGGIILFGHNYTNPAQLRCLVTALRDINPRLLLAVDQEGGRVQRLREGFLPLPSLHSLIPGYREHPDRVRRLVNLHGWAMAAEILHHGIDFSFAPVLDLYNHDSRIIAERAFSADVAVTSELARAYIGGMHEAGMRATGKHFPGHGTVVADTHLAEVIDERSAAEILDNDFQVFANCIDLLDGIMPAHVRYPAIDTDCAGFSPVWIQQKLRGQLGFQGVVFSDDVSMTAARTAGNAVQRAARALAAGCDMVLVCHDRAAALAIADYLESIGHPGSPRLAAMRATPAREISKLYATPRWQTAVESFGKP